MQRQVTKWVDEGKIKEVPIDSEYNMEDVLKVCVPSPKANSMPNNPSQGYERVASKRSKGKVVVKVS